MFKHRLSKFGKTSLFAMFMLLVGGSFQSCQDDYDLPKEEPKWLGASIYDFLKTGSPGHSYSNYVELIDSLGEKETLAHTGSKTLFVADDAAFERFFEDNPWGVKSISEMSKSQMRYLFYNSMLDNALLLDMLSSSGPKEDDEGKILRRTTSYPVIDSIPMVEGVDMPRFNKYWDALRGTERDAALRIAKDGAAPMMVHFLYDYLKAQTIKASDIEFLFRKNGEQLKTYTDNEALIFDRKLVASGVPTDGFSDDTMTITCKNGYIYRLDEVLLAPSNMAEELRNHENTKVFSHLLDRFCIPVYDASLSANYQAYHKTNDSIFRLRYFNSDDFTSYPLLESKGANPVIEERLVYDPGKNDYAVSGGSQLDMAAMLVPNDEAFYEYFTSGSGSFLVEQFAPSVEISDMETLVQALDSIPEINVASLLNNLMQRSFRECVASKFDKVKDDANDDMGLKEKDVDECIIANNGVIYILNNVFGPADYRAVHAPSLVFDNMLLIRNCISQLRYDYYLKAMDAEYSFIIPDDGNFVYHDPVSFSSNEPKVYSYHYNNERPKNNTKNDELWADIYEFDPSTYAVTDTLTPKSYALNADKPFGDTFMKNRMTDLLEYLIVVHDGRGEGIVQMRNEDGSVKLNPRKYYMTKGYGTIKVVTTDPDGIVKFYGGEQIENGTEITYTTMHEQDNGFAFCTVPYGDIAPSRKASGIPTPPTKSVYTNFVANSEEEGDVFYEFSNLCMPDTLELLMGTMFPKAKDKAIKEDSMRLYSIFFNDGAAGKIVNLVSFFNTYHYTVYVPSNEAIKKMVENGLPTWDIIANEAAVNPAKAASEMRLLNNFLRYHFQDNSVFVDNVPFSIPSPEGGRYYEANFPTAVVNAKTGRFYETVVKSDEDNSTILVTDQLNNVIKEKLGAEYEEPAKVVTTGVEGKVWNLMSRDIEFSAKSNPNIATSSYSVIQPINRALLNDGLFGYDGRFRRYAADGELVDVMAVEGLEGSVTVDGAKPYLVANVGEYEMEALDGTPKMMRVAYLMSPIDESNEAWNSTTREQYVFNGEEKVLVNEEGMLVEFVKGDDGTTVEYVTETAEDGNNYMIKVNNNGGVVERILVETEESTEPAN